MKIVYSKKYLKYHFGEGHPFWPGRAEKFIKLLERKKYDPASRIPGEEEFKYKIIDAPKGRDSDILLVHTKEYLEKVKRMVKAGGGYLSADTPVNSDNFKAAYYSVGGTIRAMEIALDEGIAVNLLGGLHHAETDKSSGFCIFNDHAIAIRKFQQKNRIRTAAVLDLDVHAGNGTQKIFYNDPSVFTVSIHQDPTLFYPGTGFTWQTGRDIGQGFNINIPLPPGTGEDDYLESLDKLVPKIETFNPDILIVVFGADTYKDDPLASFKLEKDSYSKIAKRLINFSTKVILFAGGYSRDVPEIWYKFISNLEV